MRKQTSNNKEFKILFIITRKKYEIIKINKCISIFFLTIIMFKNITKAISKFKTKNILGYVYSFFM